MIRQEIKNIRYNKSDIKKFVYTVVVFLLILYVLIFLLTDKFYPAILVISLLVFIIYKIAPFILFPLYKIWMSIAIILGFITSTIILVLLFYFLFTPVGLLIKLMRKDLLNLKLQKDSKTYWNKRDYLYSKIKSITQY